MLELAATATAVAVLITTTLLIIMWPALRRTEPERDPSPLVLEAMGLAIERAEAAHREKILAELEQARLDDEALLNGDDV